MNAQSPPEEGDLTVAQGDPEGVSPGKGSYERTEPSGGG